MKAPKNISYPVRLGKKNRNILYSQEGEIRLGRWFDLNQDTRGKAKWIRVPAKGSIVDRSLGGMLYSEKMEDYAVLTYFTDPLAQMPRFDMIPIDSGLFDTEDDITERRADLYDTSTYASSAKKGAEALPHIAIATALFTTIILAGSVRADTP